MIKYAKITNTDKGICQIGTGTDIEFYKSLGMSEMDVEKSEIDGQWYISEKLQTEEYMSSKIEFEKAKRIEEIKKELYELDLKSIRAIREGGEDDEGRLFSDVYQQEINALRTEMDNLELK